ncbi:uncharacterized protein [Oryza sativa Japonica Group]|jgi:hypothetical protein|uniref:OJ991113_30.11 protein n=5 Tax=Oryza TaxID=4527 RepID=A3AV25_ORYSJ|nr:E3 ubiquitin-protein ligase RNF149-like [Oryza sativa Japonica Group]EAY94619.1 hypothetical protein OsI_16395 [Oryza sativa Indica Group]EAZ31164.1 hypothetical protein OsJ_15262 [Oryza sativa Japonica Group]KAF2934629.1 hypothetical protein DAI22_04g177500 [Oryza sativa Japonica Group]USH99992.1 zinc finger protein [Oryza sativa Japonica Group]CAD41327.2 OJ991113_30.11 [Oryza sativa Japonica Group]
MEKGGFIAIFVAFGLINLGLHLYERAPGWLVWMLGGVTTLDRALGDCSMCRYGMVAGDVVRTLSCGHVFHKDCDYSVDKWLREHGLSCPECRKKARSVRVLPWRARPQQPLPEEQNPPPQETSASSSSSSSTHVRIAPEEPGDLDLEAQDQLLPPPATGSPKGPEEQHPPRPAAATSSSSADTSSLEEPLLRPSASP